MTETWKMKNYKMLIEVNWHFARVSFTTSVDFTKSTAADDPMNAEVIHCQLR